MIISYKSQSLEVDLPKGGSILNLTLSSKGKSRTVISPQKGYHYESSLLFPFPNRLAAGKFSFEGQEYTFPLNDFGKPNALHGFIHDKPFSVLSQEEGRLVLSYIYNGELPFYPFPFEMTVSYELVPESLRVAVMIQNTGDSPLPCAFGWHPYFNVQEGASEVTLQLSNVELIDVNDNLIPTGKSTPYKTLEQATKLSELQLDNCFRFLKENEKNAVELHFPDDSVLEVWQDKSLPFTQLYTPVDGKTVAIEPMTSNINALNNDDGLCLIAPHQSLDLRFGVSLR